MDHQKLICPNPSIPLFIRQELTLSADEQSNKLKEFLESAYQAAKSVIKTHSPAVPDVPPISQ